MLIALYSFIMNVALPQIGAYANALLEPMMAIFITLAGIVMLFGAVGIKISNNLGSTVMNGIFRGIGYLFQTLFKAISWIIRETLRLLPRVFRGSRQAFTQMGLTPLWSNLLAVLSTGVVLAIII